jgi:hypothetical protein
MKLLFFLKIQRQKVVDIRIIYAIIYENSRIVIMAHPSLLAPPRYPQYMVSLHIAAS